MYVFSDEERIHVGPANISFFCLLLVSVLFYNFISKVDEEIGKVLLKLCEWRWVVVRKWRKCS